MVKAAALYMVIIISLVIAVISISLLSMAYYYRLEGQKKSRLDRLNANLESGTSILLSTSYDQYDQEMLKDLYSDHKDSVILNKIHWGVFELNTVKTFEQKDTLQHAFLTGCTYKDSAAIYLADEDRPLSLNGDTRITGDGELPKSGLKACYVDGKSYTGKELIKGKMSVSKRGLPELDDQLINGLLQYFSLPKGMNLNVRDSVVNSFFNPVQNYKLSTTQQKISGLKLKGKIVLVSDKTLTLDQNMVLENVLIYAPVIIIKDGFRGSCQLFARDSIIIGKNCNFLYPSFAGVFKYDKEKQQSKIYLGERTHFSGILFSYEKQRSNLQTMISFGKDCLVRGEVYATGYIKMETPLTVFGKVYAKRFITQKASSLYENYLIDIVLNRKSLSKYYLSSSLFKRNVQDNGVLAWLN